MVWNRRATKKGGKINPPEMWVWSEQPTHEPVVTRHVLRRMFESFRLQVRYEQGCELGDLPRGDQGGGAGPPADRFIRALRSANERSRRRVFPSGWCPRQDSNLRTTLRRRVLYPLSYGGPDHSP
jgi:hypothetical protein